MILIAGSYYATARLGLSLAFEHSSITAVWPPTGIALAALVLWGHRLWPGVALGAFLANMTTGEPIGVVLGMATGNTLEALVGYLLLVRVARFRPSLERVRDVLALAGLAAMLSTMVSATAGVASLWLANELPTGELGSAWRVWWLGDMGGDLLVAPLILVFGARQRFPEWLRVKPARVVEAFAPIVAIVVLSILTFSNQPPIAYTIFPVVMWMAFRFRQQGATVASLIVAVIAVWFTARGMGPFIETSLDNSLLLSQTFVTGAAVTALLLAAVTSERARAEYELQRAHDDLAAKVRARTIELEHSNAQLELQSAIAQNMAEGVALVRASDASIVYTNRTFELMFGYEPGELTGKPVADLNANSENGSEETTAEIISALNRDESWSGEVHNVKKDGTAFWCQANISTFDDPEHGLVWVDVHTDISERKAAEAALQEINAALDEAVESMSMLDREGRYIHVNKVYAKTCGYEGGEMAGLHWSVTVHAEDRGTMEQAQRSMVENGKATAELKGIRKDGSVFHGEVVLVGNSDEHGDLNGYYCFMKDITSRKQAEQALKASQAKLAEAQRVAHIGSWEWSIETDEVTWSSELYRICGLEPEQFEASYEGFLQCIHPDDREFVNGVVQSALVRAVPFTFEHRIVRPDGSVRVLHGLGTVETDEHGKSTRLLGTSQDVTEQKHIQQEADRMKDEFLGVVSHELRTPLTSILGYLELLLTGRAGELSEKQRRFLEVIERNSVRQLRIVGDLLAALELEANQFSLERTTVELGALVKDCVEEAVPKATDRQVRLSHHMRSSPVCAGDHDRLAQLLNNLLSNAIKFTPPEGQIHVNLASTDGQAVIEVTNTGSYIPPEERSLLFERFFRGRSATEGVVHGIGLGLTIAKAIVDGHGGRIKVESEEDFGTTFRVWIPLADRSEAGGVEPEASGVAA